MKTCPTCGMNAEDRVPFCTCCGTSFVVCQPVSPTDETLVLPVTKSIDKTQVLPVKTPAKKTQVLPAKKTAPPPPLFEEEDKKRGHTLPIVIIAILTVLAVGLSALWLSGGLEAMLKKDSGSTTNNTQKPTSFQPTTLPTIAAVYENGKELTTGQYLAYLYLEFENLYYSQGLYQYEAYGTDPWTLTFPYGQDGEELLLSDYIIRATQDNVKRQIVLTQMMEEYDIPRITEDEAELNKDLTTLEKDAFIDLGFDNDSYIYAVQNAYLNERSLFYGLYGKGGARAVDELELRRYFSNNYVSYKIISIPLTDATGKALDKNSAAYQKITDKMSQLLSVSQQNGFNAAYVLHTGQPAENARQTTDGITMDEALVQAIGSLPYNKPTIVEYMAGGTTPTIALIERLNTNDMYEQSVENIIYTLRYEAFNTEVTEAMERLDITFDNTVIARNKPEDFLTIEEYP